MNQWLRSLVNATGTLVYVSAVALFLSNGEQIFGDQEKTFIIPVFMLLLLILSASITGLLVLGKPISLYFNGFRKEAVILLGLTLGWLVIFLMVIAVTFLLR